MFLPILFDNAFMFLLLVLDFRLDWFRYLKNLITPKYLEPQTQMDTLKTKRRTKNTGIYLVYVKPCPYPKGETQGRDPSLVGHGTGTRRLAAHLNELGTSNRILVLSQRFLGFVRDKPIAIRQWEMYSERLFQRPQKRVLERDYQFFTAVLSDMDHFTLGFPYVFHRLFHPFKEQWLGKNNFHLRWQRLLSFEEVYFQTS